jgi:hypothetical protein
MIRSACVLAALLSFTEPARAYITYPVVTLGAAVDDSTYVTLLRVEKVGRDKGMIVFSKVRDLKGKYPKETIKHVFDLKGTPAHKGSGDVPVRPDAKDWKYAVEWAEAGKTAVFFSRKYDPFGDFGHVYIDGLWYATMCPPRDWEFWYAIYSDPKLLSQWHAGPADPLMRAIESLAVGRSAVVPVLAGGSKDDLRTGKAKFQALEVRAGRRDFDPKRDLFANPLDASAVPGLVKSLADPSSRDVRARAAGALGLIGRSAKDAIVPLAAVVRSDTSGTARIAAAEALALLGADAKTAALPAIEAALGDPKIAQRKDVRDALTRASNVLKAMK